MSGSRAVVQSTEYFFLGSVFSEDFQTYNISTEVTLYNDSFKKGEAG